MSPRWEEDDIQVLRHAAKLQSATKQSLYRIQNQVTDTELLGCTTLEQLQQQREHLDKIMIEGDRLEVSLKTTDKLLNRYNRNSLRFNNARAAMKLVKKEAKFRKGLEEKARERAAEISQQIDGPEEIEVSTGPVITKHSQKRDSKSTRNKTRTINGGKPIPVPTQEQQQDHKRLLFGMDSVAPDEELQQLEQGDDEIEVALEGLGSSIDQLVRMSDEITCSVQSHDKSLQHINQQLEQATTVQQVANHRSRWFLSGKKRESYERQEFFNRNSLIRKAIF